jgi:hypothetical protein
MAKRHVRVTGIILLLSVLPFSPTVRTSADDGESISNGQPVLWRLPAEIRTRNLFYGPGGQRLEPRAPFRFIREDRGGTAAKFIIEDARKARWKVKLGEEARPETAATRLLWAVGYFADVNYYIPRLRVAGMRPLSRGQKYISRDGQVTQARLELMVSDSRKVDDWSWFNNPFIGTRQFDGLRVMMALMNNWDLKEMNNAIYAVSGGEQHYVVSDLGATFGKTGGKWSRSKGDVEDYLESEFFEKVTPSTVDLTLHSRPPIVLAAYVPYYRERTRMGKISEDIPRAHAKWIGQLLSQLSERQISDAFRAAGYSPTEVQHYSRKVHERIEQLNAL